MSGLTKGLFVGLNTIDLQFCISDFPKPNTKFKAKKNNICSGGPATNAAITFSFLGGEADLLSPIGNHSLNQFILDELDKYDVHVIDPAKDKETEPVFASIITSDINGDRTIFSYHPPSYKKSQKQELNIAETNKYSIALFDGFYPELAIYLAAEFRKSGITTVLDGGSWKPGMEKLLRYVDIAVCSDDFVPPGAINIQQRFELIKSYGVKEIAITRGDKPILFTNTNEITELHISEQQVVDTLGAGDVFHGAFCYFYSLYADMERALLTASDVATESCRYFGTREWMEHFQLPLNRSG